MTITWDNPDELEEYISRLQSAADRLTSENRRLRKCHGTLVDKVLVCTLLQWCPMHAGCSTPNVQMRKYTNLKEKEMGLSINWV